MRRFLMLMAGAIIVVTTWSVIAESGLAQSTCAALVNDGYAAIVDSCGNMPGNSACYGADANATFAESAEGAFSENGDILSLMDVDSIMTLPFNAVDGQWGVARLAVHANVPLALSESGLTYLQFGDVTIENAVDRDTAFTPPEPVMVTSIVGANLRSAPTTDARVVGSAQVGAELAADGLSLDRGWLHVFADDVTAWISRQVIVPTEGNPDDLPVITSDSRTLMQSFFLHTDIETAECDEQPPSLLMIQSPADVGALITANDADIRFTGTIVLRNIVDNNFQLIVVDGAANTSGITVPPGFTMTVPLSEDGRSGAGPWTGLRPISEDERIQLLPLESISSQTLYDSVHVPTVAEVATTLAQINAAAVGGQSTAGPAAGLASCAGFVPTSPLDYFASGPTTFYWDGSQGATRYRVNVYDEFGTQLTSQELDAFNTTYTIDTGGAIGGGSNFAWDVQALVDGQVACTTGRVSVVRVGPVRVGSGGGLPTPTACPWKDC